MGGGGWWGGGGWGGFGRCVTAKSGLRKVIKDFAVKIIIIIMILLLFKKIIIMFFCFFNSWPFSSHNNM